MSAVNPPGAGQLRQKLTLALLLAALVGVLWMVGAWILRSWMQSPMDRQAPLLLLLLLPWFGWAAWQRVANPVTLTDRQIHQLAEQIGRGRQGKRN